MFESPESLIMGSVCLLVGLIFGATILLGTERRSKSNVNKRRTAMVLGAGGMVLFGVFLILQSFI